MWHELFTKYSIRKLSSTKICRTRLSGLVSFQDFEERYRISGYVYWIPRLEFVGGWRTNIRGDPTRRAYFANISVTNAYKYSTTRECNKFWLPCGRSRPNYAAISNTMGNFILSNIAVVRLAIMICIHEVSRSTLGPFPRRHHVTFRCCMAYPEDEGFQALQRQVVKTVHYLPRVCSSYTLNTRVCQCRSHWTFCRKISKWRLSLTLWRLTTHIGVVPHR